MTIQEINTKILELSEMQDVDVFTIGYSLLGKPIFGVHIGKYDGDQILIEGAIHAREYITSLLLIEQIKYLKNQQFDGGFYFVPMVNPDGVDLVLEGVKNIKCDNLKQFLLIVNNNKKDFGQWKANANAVDMNTNFDADWGKGARNIFCPAPANFVGYYPQSEREVIALKDFTHKNRPQMTISYHSRGQVIYYGFTSQTAQQLARDLRIANEIAEATRYMVMRSYDSVAGYSDWVIKELNIPAITIEVGCDDWAHPITEFYLPQIFEQNKLVPLIAMNALRETKKMKVL